MTATMTTTENSLAPLLLSPEAPHAIESANYVTNVEPALHPNRIMEVHDFLYILEGTWEIYEEDTPFSLKTDDLLILQAGKHHYGKLPSSAGNRHMYIHLYREPEPSRDSSCPEISAGPAHPSSAVSRDSSCPEPSTAPTAIALHSLYHCGSNPRIRQLFKDLIATYWSDSLQKTRKLSLLFSLLLCELSELDTRKNSVSKHAAMLDQVNDLLQTNPHTLYSCSEVADLLYICPRTLSNVFMQNYGVSFYQYQMNRKLEMVRQYLSDHPDELLYNVARNFGFCDEYHLSKNYKKKYGQAPKRHIKNCSITV